MKITKLLFYILIGLPPSILNAQSVVSSLRINELRENLLDSENDKVIVVAHRGDWRNSPENSLPAIESCIRMGVDMVEIDVQETKDGHLILMHDYTLDRTTNGKGFIKDWTLDSLKELFLKDGIGHVTPHKIPTLKEALGLCKSKILVNLDKSYAVFGKCYEIAKQTETLGQIIIKGYKPYEVVKEEFGNYMDQVFYMPIIKTYEKNHEIIIDGFLQQKKLPVAIEFTIKTDTISLIGKFSNYRKMGISIWVNSLWPDQNGGHDDEKAYENQLIYDWFIENNIDIIQTDRPQLLINYLRTKGLHR